MKLTLLKWKYQIKQEILNSGAEAFVVYKKPYGLLSFGCWGYYAELFFELQHAIDYCEAKVNKHNRSKQKPQVVKEYYL